jgi:spectinomycin phosphotransferase
MLEKPDLGDERILSCLRDEYGLIVVQATFLPIGADPNAAAYRIDTDDGRTYFLKLSKGGLKESAVEVPRLLKAQGVQAVLAPLETRKRQAWGKLGDYTTILYPFIQGKDAFEQRLSEAHWITFGIALKGVHTAQVPPALSATVPKETYPPHWRETVRAFQAQIKHTTFEDPTAARLAAFMQTRQSEINHLVERAEQLGNALQGRSQEFVLCHGDIHAGNLLISAAGDVYLVDWDTSILAPKERDLMFVGAGIGGTWRSEREAAWFYQGYNGTGERVDVDQTALAYYRYERIVEDIAAFCGQLLLTGDGGADREQAYRYFTSQFMPGCEVEIAFKSDPGDN